MADNPNQSGNRRPPNTLAELGASAMPSSILRTLEGVSPENTQRYQRLTEQIGRIQENPLYQLGQSNPLLLTHADAARQYRGMESRLGSYRRQQEIMEESAAGRANRMVGTGVNQSFSSATINGQVSSRLESTAAQQESLRIAARVDPESLQRRIKRSENRMAGYGSEAASIETVNRFGERDPDAEQRLQQLYGLRELEIDRRTGLTGAARIQRMQGLDPRSRADSLINSVGKAQGVLASQSPDVQNLTGLSAGAFRKREIEAADRLAQSFEKLSQVSDTTSEQFKELKKDVDNAEKQFKDIQTARGAGGGGGGGGGGDGWRLAAAGFGAAGMAVQQIGVNQRLAQQGNIAGYAGFQNEIYQTYKAANAGDVASMMLLPQFQAAEGFGFQLKAAANIAVGARGLGGLAQTAAGGIEAASTLDPISDVLNASSAAGALKAGGMDMVSGGATAAEAASDLARGVSGRQADIAGRQARMAAARALQAVSAEQIQGFRDFGVGMGGAAQGMGLGGDAFLRSTTNAGTLGRLAGARISPEQFAAMAGQGVNAMGSGFNSDQIFGARALERRGLGSAQSNLDRMSQLYAAGANNPQEGLGRILADAIPKGFDNSKLVGQLVQYSAQAATGAGGAATGLNLTGAASRLLTSGIGPGTVNKEALLQHSADLQGAFRGIETNISTSYAGMVSVARAQRTLGRGGISAVVAESLPTELLMGLRDNPNSKALINAGLSPNTKPEQLEGLIRNRQLKELEAGGTGLLFGNLSPFAEKMRAAGSYNNMQPEDQLQLSQIAKLAVGANATGEDLAKRFFGTSTKSTVGPQEDIFSDKGVGTLQKSMDDLRTQGFVQLSVAAKTAADQLDKISGAGKGIDALVSAFKAVEKTIETTEKAGGTAAAKGATGGRGFDTTQWDLAGKKLNLILDRIITKQSGSPVPSQRAEMPQ